MRTVAMISSGSMPCRYARCVAARFRRDSIAFQDCPIVAITSTMPVRWTPRLELREAGRRCRLSLGGWAQGEGETLQEAAGELVAGLQCLAVRFRSSGLSFPPTLGRPDVRELDFLSELGDIAARGGDIRERVFGQAAAE